MSKNVLVTGSGGIGGVNFVNALKLAKREYSISGTDFNKYIWNCQIWILNIEHQDIQILNF